MENLFGKLFLDLCAHLKASVPELRWIDQDFGQLERFEYRPEVSFPCVLIDFVAANYSNMSNLKQIGDIAVNLRLGFSPFSQSYHAAPLDVKQKALEYYTTEHKVFLAVQGWAPLKEGEPVGGETYTQPFIRKMAVTEHRDNDPIGMRVRVLTFDTSVEDETAGPVYIKVPANVQIETDLLLPD